MADMQIVYHDGTIHEINFSNLISYIDFSGDAFSIAQVHQVFRGGLSNGSTVLPQSSQILYEYNGDLVMNPISGTEMPNAWRPGVIFLTPPEQINSDPNAPGLYRSVSAADLYLSYNFMVHTDDFRCVLKTFEKALTIDGFQIPTTRDYSGFLLYVPLVTANPANPLSVNASLEDYRAALNTY